MQYLQRALNENPKTYKSLIDLNLSVLAGEYLKDIDSFNSKISVNNILNNNMNSESEEDKGNNENHSIDSFKKDSLNTEGGGENLKQNDNSDNQFCDDLFKKALKNYKTFAENIHSNNENIITDRTDQRRFYKSKRIRLKPDIEHASFTYLPPEYDYYFIFLINISLADFDEYFESSQEHENELDYYLDKLNAIDSDKDKGFILKALSDKCEYLKFKIKFREYRDYSDVEPIYSGDNYYTKFIEDTKNHYNTRGTRIDNCSSFISGFGSTFNLERNNLSAKSDIHKINKFYKSSESIEPKDKKRNIDLLIEKISTLNCDNSFDRISNNSAINLLENTKLKILLDTEIKNKFKQVLNDSFFKSSKSVEDNVFIKELKEFINKKNYVDYIGFKSVIDFYDKLFNQLEISDEILTEIELLKTEDIKDEDLLKYRENILKNLESLEYLYTKTLSKSSENITFLRNYELKPIYLSLEECLTNEIKIDGTDNDNIKLFLDSSYILPINFENAIEKNAKNKLGYSIELKLIKEKFSSKIANIISENHIKIQKDDLTKTIKEGEFKTVQIVAMFVTIASFILTSVKIFDNKSAFESFCILIGLGGVFTLFNAFFNWLIIKQIYSKEGKVINNNMTNFLFSISASLILFSYIGLVIKAKYFTDDLELNKKIQLEVEKDIKSKKIKTNYNVDSTKINCDFKIIENRLNNLEVKK